MKISSIVQTENRAATNTLFAELMNEVLSANKNFRFRAGGGSMFPFIWNNDILTIEKINNPIHLGDVIVIHNHDINLMVHRIISITESGYTVKGDYGDDVDGIFPISDFLGKVICIERGNKKITFGLGEERIIISLLSKYRIIIPLVKFGKKIIRLFLLGKLI